MNREEQTAEKERARGILRKHLSPTLHNAMGGVITIVIVASYGTLLIAFKAVRDFSFRVAMVAVPLYWLLLLVLLATVAIVKLAKDLRAARKRLRDAEAERAATSSRRERRPRLARGSDWVNGWRK